MKNLLVMSVILAAFIIWGRSLACPSVRYSEPITEEAVVEATPFAPAQSGSGMGVGIGAKGSPVTTVSSVDLEASYAIVLRCEAHGRFAVQGSDARHQQLWSRFKVGDRVSVTYRRKLDGDGQSVGLDFLDAQPVR